MNGGVEPKALWFKDHCRVGKYQEMIRIINSSWQTFTYYKASMYAAVHRSNERRPLLSMKHTHHPVLNSNHRSPLILSPVIPNIV